jgi:hypothetical protein
VGLLPGEHLRVGGTPTEAAARQHSFKRKDGVPPAATDAERGNRSVDVRGEKRPNKTDQHASAAC